MYVKPSFPRSAALVVLTHGCLKLPIFDLVGSVFHEVCAIRESVVLVFVLLMRFCLRNICHIFQVFKKKFRGIAICDFRAISVAFIMDF